MLGGHECTSEPLQGGPLLILDLAPVSDVTPTHDNTVSREHDGYLAEEGEASHPGPVYPPTAGHALLAPVGVHPPALFGCAYLLCVVIHESE